jgi:hypothetical protein
MTQMKKQYKTCSLNYNNSDSMKNMRLLALTKKISNNSLLNIGQYF